MNDESIISPRWGAYSHSKLDGGCDLKFKFQYIDKEIPFDAEKHGTEQGSACHRMAELEIENLSDDISIEERISRMLVAHPEWEIFRKDLEESCRKFRKFFMPTIKESAMLGCELDLGATLNMEPSGFFDKETWFRGKCDYSEAERGHVRVVDFKNYPRIHDEDELENTGVSVGAQMMGYIALIMSLDETIESGHGEIYYFRYGAIRKTRSFSRSEVEEWWKFNQRRILSMEGKTKFEAQPSRKACTYCSFMHSCPYTKSVNNFFAKNEDEAGELAKRLVMIEEEKERIKKGIAGFLDASNDGTIEINKDITIGHTEKLTREIDTEMVFRIAQNAGLDPFKYVNATWTAVQKLEKDLHDEEYKEQLKGAYKEIIKTTRRYK